MCVSLGLACSEYQVQAACNIQMLNDSVDVSEQSEVNT